MLTKQLSTTLKQSCIVFNIVNLLIYAQLSYENCIKLLHS